MKKIFLTGQTDKKPRREIRVDEFSYSVSTSSGESTVTLPGSRTYDTVNDYLVVDANGIKINEGVHYTAASSTTVSTIVSEMFPNGEFPANCVLNFELYTTN